MILDKNAILSRLSDGEEAQTIADEIADMLNETISEHLEIQKKKEKEDDKIKDADFVIQTFCDFIEMYYPDIYDDSIREITGKDLVKVTDEALEEVRKVQNVFGDLESLIAKLEKDQSKSKPTFTKEVDPIKKFLSEYVDY